MTEKRVTNRRVTLKPLSLHPLWGAVGVLSAGLILTEVNLLSARKFTRFDLSEDSSFTLSPAFRAVLSDSSADTEILVLLSSGDPRLSEVRQLLETVKAARSSLKVRYIDPDRDLAEFLALGKQYDIGTDHLAETGVISDAALLLRSGTRKWFIRSDRLRPNERGLSPVLVAELTDGLSRVRGRPEERICFVTGHGEASLDDAAEEGLLELRTRLIRSNLKPERVPLDVPDPEAALRDCHAVVVVGPTRPYPTAHEDALLQAEERGASLLLFVDPIVDDTGRLSSVKLDRAASRLGVRFSPGFVLEKDAEHRFPSSLGEAFFPQVKSHPLTRGLSQDSARTDARVILNAAGPLELLPNTTATPLLSTTPKAEVLQDLSTSVSDKNSQGGPFTLAAALSRNSKDDKVSRSVAVSCSSVLSNASFREPAYYGNRLWVENIFSWTLHRPMVATSGTDERKRAGLGLDESALGAVLRYVLIYMPLLAASLGGALLIRRSRKEASSRKEEGSRS